MTERDDRSGDPYGDRVGNARRDWFAQALGDEWLPQGDGTYRLAGSDAPIARDDADRDGVRPDASDEPISRDRHLHLPRLPWRRR